MTIEKKVARQLTLQGIRFANNILAEMIGNYSKFIPEDARVMLTSAAESLAKADYSIRSFKD